MYSLRWNYDLLSTTYEDPFRFRTRQTVMIADIIYCYQRRIYYQYNNRQGAGVEFMQWLVGAVHYHYRYFLCYIRVRQQQ
jgi:hypothetical protein